MKPLSILKKLPVFLLSRSFHKAFHTTEKEVSGKLGLGVRESWILIASHAGTFSQKSVAEMFRINQNVMVSLVDDLEGRNLIKRVKNPDNRREYVLTVTPKGREITERLLQKAQEFVRTVMHPLTSEEVDELCRLLRKYCELD